ncbi:hypothetical protein CRUP_014648 [Coryphaenoides rupestris]|nr:hypothetical protein CRUP_014648 [Coryphaenoides rupestris]
MGFLGSQEYQENLVPLESRDMRVHKDYRALKVPRDMVGFLVFKAQKVTKVMWAFQGTVATQD